MCEHRKVYKILTFGTIEGIYCNPYYPWVCEDCLESGTDYRWRSQGSNDYDALVRKKEDASNQDIAENKWRIRNKEARDHSVITFAG